MKTNRLKVLGLSLLFMLSFYQCKKTSDPTVYTFDPGLTSVTLPPVTPVTPAPVTSTTGSVAVPAATTATLSGVSSGKVDASVTSTVTTVGSVVPAADAAKISAAFTPTVVSDLLSKGTLPTDLAASVASISTNPALAAYLPKITLPSVNGTPVTGFKNNNVTTSNDLPTAAIPLAKSTTATGDFDACNAAATAAFNKSLKSLDSLKAINDAAINASFATQLAAVGTSAACKADVATQQTATNAKIKADLDAFLVGLNGLLANKTIDQATYNLLSVFIYVSTAVEISAYNNYYTALSKSCDVKIAAATAAINDALKTTLASSNASYQTKLDALNAAKTKAVADCHNQGQGN